MYLIKEEGDSILELEIEQVYIKYEKLKEDGKQPK